MLKPSGRPIRSSWSIEPRLVKNCLPSTSWMLWRRPLVSVSRIPSPGWRGPRRTPDPGGWEDMAAPSHAGSQPPAVVPAVLPARRERLVDVVGDQHAEEAAVAVDEEVLRRRR